MEVLKCIVRNFNGYKDRLQYVDMIYYILRKDGAYAGVSLWEGYGDASQPHDIAVRDGTKRREKTVALLQGMPQSWPPIKRLS